MLTDLRYPSGVRSEFVVSVAAVLAAGCQLVFHSSDDAGPVKHDAAKDAAVDADPTCVCSGNDLTCSSGTRQCDFGCISAASAGGGAVCASYQPSNGADWNDFASVTAGLTLGGGQVGTLDLATGDIVVNGTVVHSGYDVSGGIASRSTGGNVYVALNSLQIESGATFTIMNSATATARPVIFTVRGDVVVNGTLDVSGLSFGGCGLGHASNSGFGGGSGGAFGAASGAGASGDGQPTGITAGVNPCGNNVEAGIAIGSFGGGGRIFGGNGIGGAGGGAVQISAVGTFTQSGVVVASGRAGTKSAEGGNGGGSGGAILIEATNYVGSGTCGLYANGGSGSGGNNEEGIDGLRSTLPAKPPGHGGSGGALQVPAAEGTTTALAVGSGTIYKGGGGGGSVGKIAVRSRNLNSSNMCTSSPAARIIALP
jgi:hypothetical protein